jgi:heme/copper-type cytochrome/quinol oxidase subunit 2
MEMNALKLAALGLIIGLALPAAPQPLETPSVRIHVDASLRRLAPTKVGRAWFLAGGFSPSLIEVQQGQQVVLELTSVEGLHSLAISGYGIQTSEVRTGETTSLVFIANQAGDFSIECRSKCGGLHRRMTGTLVVKP